MGIGPSAEAWVEHCAKQLGWPMFPEYRFHPVRKWRFDFAFPDQKVAVEMEGLLPGAGGRHQRITGYRADTKKYNAATCLGWRILRYAPQDLAQLEDDLAQLQGDGHV